MVDIANGHLPAHAQLDVQHVRVLRGDVILPRSLKGKVQRAAAIALLNSEIEDMYREAESTNGLPSSELDFTSQQTLERSISIHLAQLNPNWDGLPTETDFFSAGMDSLQVTRLLRLLNLGVRNQIQQSPLVSRIIYDHPSVRKLAWALRSLYDDPESLVVAKDEIEEMRLSLRELEGSLPTTTVDVRKPRGKGLTIILTGSTGSLGCQLLHVLMQCESIEAIHCLNRTSDSHIRQATLHTERGLRLDFARRNVTFHFADLSQHYLGLGREYHALLSSVDCILHMAWSVNWNAPVSSFKPQLLGCCNLAAFSAGSSRRPRIIFASSVGAANGITPEISSIREEPMINLSSAEATGYSRSKLVAERLFDLASGPKLRLPITICRIGQIAGSTDGTGWTNSREWLPSLVSASSTMGVLPNTLGSMDIVDWIPLNVLTECLVGLAVESAQRTTSTITATLRGLRTGRDQQQATYLHLINPNWARWSESLCSPLAAAMDGVELVSLIQWVKTLEDHIKNDDNMSQSSAASLVDFYRSLAERQRPLPTFDTSIAYQKCPALRNSRAIRPEWLSSWMQAWSLPARGSIIASTCEKDMSLKSQAGMAEMRAGTSVKQSLVKVHHFRWKLSKVLVSLVKRTER